MENNLLDDLGYLNESKTETVLDQENPRFVYADSVLRFSAACIDLVVLMVISVGCVFILYVINYGIFLGSIGDFAIYPYRGLLLVYFPILESSKYQATIGKLILNIKVVNKEGNRLSFGHAAVRSAFKILSGMMFCMGFVMIALTQKKQGLHDMFADTFVVENNTRYN